MQCLGGIGNVEPAACDLHQVTQLLKFDGRLRSKVGYKIIT
jgi:hypothetical protein